MTETAENDPVVAHWKNLVYNKEITKKEVHEAYKEWAKAYDEDFETLHPDRSQHMVNILKELLEKSGKDYGKVKILDVAAGTGIVGEDLADAGFTDITALDFSKEMLDVAGKKGAYNKLVESSFGNTIPNEIAPHSYDCVIMVGGFAAGHLPLSSLHTMARCCKKGGFVVNSMTLQYTHFVDEYKKIDQYVEELAESGVWKVMTRQILDQYIKGKQGLMHAMQVL